MTVCDKLDTPNDCQHIKDSLDESINIQIDYAKQQQEKHEHAEKAAEIKLEQVRRETQDNKTKQLEKDLQKQIDAERGRVVFWRTKTEQLECVGTNERATFMRSIAQQNMKDENGDHTYYDPRNYRSGVAFGGAPRKHD